MSSAQSLRSTTFHELQNTNQQPTFLQEQIQQLSISLQLVSESSPFHHKDSCQSSPVAASFQKFPKRSRLMTSHLQTTSSKKKWLWGNFEAIMGIVDVLPTGWKVCQTGACPTNSTCHDLSGCCSWEGLDQCPIGRTFSHVTSFLSPLQSSCSELLRCNVKTPFPASIHLYPQRHACAHTHTTCSLL